MKTRHLAALILLGLCLLPSSISRAQSVTRTFTAPDGSFSFRYWNQLVQCKPPQEGNVWEPADVCAAYIPVCDGLLDGHGIACFAYPRNKFTNTPAFEAATFSVETLDSRKTEKTCVVGEPVAGDEKTGTIAINGVGFTFSDFGDGGMNQGTTGRAYRTFHGGKCYQLGTNFATSNAEVYDPPIRSLTERDINEVNSKLEQALKSFRFLK